jgi:hypothetical protein
MYIIYIYDVKIFGFTRSSIYCIYDISRLRVKVKGKGKAIPLQALTGPEGFRRLRIPDFKTVAT